MWKRSGRSSALDRAQALLSAKRNRGDVESVQGSTGNTGAVGGSLKTKSASLSTHPLLSDLSDLSSVSSAPEHGGDTMLGSAAASGKTQAREGLSTMDLRPQSSPGGGGSRFLKKAPPPAAISSLSPPVSKSHMQHVPEHRNVSSSQRGSQTAALSRLAQIESRIRSRKPVQVQEQEKARWGPKPAENLNSDVDVSPPPAARSLEAPVQLSAQSSSDQTRFLKNKTAVAASDNITTAAARSPKGADVGVRSRAADAVVPLVGLETKQVRVVSGVSLESDEEDMRKLLGDSLDSVDNSVSIPGRRSSAAHSSPPPPAAVPPSSSSNTAPPRSPASPPRRSSPFRFAGQAQAHFSPSLLFSPSPSPPFGSPRGAGSPRRSLSSASGRGEEVLSLEELFSEEPLSEMSAVTSEDFRINVMTLDDLGFTERTAGEEREVQHRVPPPESPNRHQERPRLKKKEKKDEQQQQQEEEEEEDALDYESDFESESRTEPDHSQVSEHLQGDGDEEEEAVSEVREEASHSDVSRGRTGDDYTGTLSDTSGSWTSGHSQKLSDSRSSRSSSSRGSRTLSRQSRRRASARKVLKETAVQTQPDPLAYTWPAGVAALGSAVAETYMDPTPAVAYTLSAEMVEALSISNPAAFALNEMLKQQLAVTRGFIESRRRLHSSLVQSLGPPSYRYTTLEDTKEYIRERRPPKLKMEEALEEVLQEMRDYHHI